MSLKEVEARPHRSGKFTHDLPDRLLMYIDGLSEIEARTLSHVALKYARQAAPKITGASSRRFIALHGKGFFGVAWLDSYVWFQDKGISPFTMNNLAGKTIPMWIDDPTGMLKTQNPKAKTRTTVTGMRQTLIFRRAAKIGQRKQVKRGNRVVDVPAAYPGAPGRILRRHLRQPWTEPGRIGGQVARSNVGVRWRHPGLRPREFIEYGLMRAVHEAGIPPTEIVAQHGVESPRVGGF